jgi:peptide/nickel transport system ATP-binding protein
VTALLSVSDLAVRFGAAAPVVSGVSFEVEPGECIGIVGESGSGKSVTARALLGLAGRNARVSAGTLRFGDTDLSTAPASRLRAMRGDDIGYVSQGALVALDPLRPVGREIADALRLHTSATPTQRRASVVELLDRVGVPEPELRARQYPHELSGGLRQRAIIASAIALRPRLLVADEPTTALDTTVQAGILDLLERLRDEGTALILISHDLAVVSRLASRVLVMRGGSVVESGPTDSVLARPRQPYTRQLIAAVPTDRPRGSRLVPLPPAPAGVVRALGHVGNSGDLDTTGLVDPVRAADAAASPEFPRQADQAVVVASGLTRRFGSRLAVDDVSFELRRGRTLGIVGESGSGKTTVARMVLALDSPDSGDVRVLDRPWSGATERERRPTRPRIGAIYQDAASSFDPRLTVGRILADALSHGRARRADADVEELLHQVGLDPAVARRRPRLLSGGQQQRVAIARAIAPRPDVIVCDEPVSSLDVSIQAHVLDLLDDLQRELGLSYLFITHDLGVVRHVSDDVLVMRAGRIVERGPTEAVFAAPEHEYTRALFASAPRLGAAPTQR